jgi:CDP-2,3-bis-(O-geranylgeranyl)-sn-glycerol synthase
MAPAYLANMTPPFAKYWKGWNPPISRRWLGGHKTVVGFAAGMIIAVATAWAQSAIGWSGGLIAYDSWPLVGLALGGGALAGDAVKSFFKRRRGISPGEPWVPADQVDFLVGALVFAAPWARLGVDDIVAILAVSFLGDIAVNHAAYLLGIRGSRW